ncbi:hypothetical protein AAOE16_18115 [Ekhidna sp. MALMAid0563]|uniref:hypothetical protein n=1 Tax=Ekhidna sp. MALMAid0563 TaxID=3143937 RepID=UPI0032DE4EFC
MALLFKYHRLDPEAGGYMSVHIGAGHDFLVLTTPVSRAPEEEHKKLLQSKIEALGR